MSELEEGPQIVPPKAAVHPKPMMNPCFTSKWKASRTSKSTLQPGWGGGGRKKDITGFFSLYR